MNPSPKSFRSVHSLRAEAEFRDADRRADATRAEFLKALLAKYASDSFTGAESSLLIQFRTFERSFVWTERRRERADKMMRKYRRGVR